MIFGGKFNAAMKRLREDKKERTKDEIGDGELKDNMEKGDFAAMMIAAFITFIPVALLAILIIVGAGFLFFWR